MRYIIKAHGTYASTVLVDTSDEGEARAKLKALLHNDPEGEYSIEIDDPEHD